MKANYKARKERLFASLPKSQRDMILEYVQDLTEERLQYAKKELEKEYLEEIIPKDRAEFVQFGIDLAVQQLLIELISSGKIGVRRYKGKSAAADLLQSATEALQDGLKKHSLDLDMFRFAQNRELKQWGVNYPLQNLGKREEIDEYRAEIRGMGET